MGQTFSTQKRLKCGDIEYNFHKQVRKCNCGIDLTKIKYMRIQSDVLDAIKRFGLSKALNWLQHYSLSLQAECQNCRNKFSIKIQCFATDKTEMIETKGGLQENPNSIENMFLQNISYYFLKEVYYLTKTGDYDILYNNCSHYVRKIYSIIKLQEEREQMPNA